MLTVFKVALSWGFEGVTAAISNSINSRNELRSASSQGAVPIIPQAVLYPKTSVIKASRPEPKYTAIEHSVFPAVLRLKPERNKLPFLLYGHTWLGGWLVQN